jgi:hypothetical protein
MEKIIRNALKGGKTDKKPYQYYGFINPNKKIHK